MKRLSVVIPVMRWDLVLDLLKDIESNTRIPEKVMLINNSKTPSDFPKAFSFNTEILDFGKNIGVNAAWNYAFKNCGDSHLSILNDDIRICQYFFEMTQEGLEADAKIGVVCPETVGDLEKSRDRCFAGLDLRPMHKREGWAFTVRADLKRHLPLIPDELFVFCGDDWIWTWAHELGFVWMKDFSNVIYHRIGGSLREKENRPLRALLRKEKQAYSRLIREAINEKRSEGGVPVCE